MKKFGRFKLATFVVTLLLTLSMIGVGGALAAGTFLVHQTYAIGTIDEALTVTCKLIDSIDEYSKLLSSYFQAPFPMFSQALFPIGF